MAFIFTPEGDPRGERETRMSAFKVDQVVTFEGMAMPATIISGPHKTHSATARWLINKADGTVSLVPETKLKEYTDPRIRRVAETLYNSLSGSSLRTRYPLLPQSTREMYSGLAKNVLEVVDADEPKGKADPLPSKYLPDVGDVIRILDANHAGSVTRVGDLLTVTRRAQVGTFRTHAPRSRYVDNWTFRTDAEGKGWERA